jgi:mannosyl-oligosaccharide alpha-1,2-mannosidase
VYVKLSQIGSQQGLFAADITVDSGIHMAGEPTFGARGDSFYEYLLKTWALCNKCENKQWLRDMYDESIDGLVQRQLKTSPGGAKYVTSDGQSMEHLVCFLPGLLALGVHRQPASERRSRDMQLAKGANGCCCVHRPPHSCAASSKCRV